MIRFLFVLMLWCTGCGGLISTGVATNTFQQATSAQPFRYLDIVDGESSSLWLFGFIPVTHKGGYREIFDKMRTRADLKPNQMMTNYREDVYFYSLLLVTWVTRVVSADVVEFYGRDPPPKPTSKPARPMQEHDPGAPPILTP